MAVLRWQILMVNHQYWNEVTIDYIAKLRRNRNQTAKKQKSLAFGLQCRDVAQSKSCVYRFFFFFFYLGSKIRQGFLVIGINLTANFFKYFLSFLLLFVCLFILMKFNLLYKLTYVFTHVHMCLVDKVSVIDSRDQFM